MKEAWWIQSLERFVRTTLPPTCLVVLFVTIWVPPLGEPKGGTTTKNPMAWIARGSCLIPFPPFHSLFHYLALCGFQNGSVHIIASLSPSSSGAKCATTLGNSDPSSFPWSPFASYYPYHETRNTTPDVTKGSSPLVNVLLGCMYPGT